MWFTEWPRAGLVLAVAAFWSAPAAQACSVPVFRWALERWPSDPYTLVVLHDKPLADADTTRLESLEDAKTAANVEMLLLDTTQPPDNPEVVDGVPLAGFLDEHKGESLPRAFLLSPEAAHVPGPVWSGSPGELDSASLLDSPARREVTRRILDGESGVWLLLSSGDAVKDSAAEAMLKEQIDHANKTLLLPDMTGDPVLEGPEPPDISNLRVEFSLLRVGRDDPAEAFLVRMLLGVEADLAEYREPIAFPVYGRGRVLYALVGAGINPDTIMKACAFLVGRCACEIKAENPGTDLVMSADWDSAIGDDKLIGRIDLPPLPGTAIEVPAPLQTAPAEDEDSGYGLVHTIALAVGAGVVLVAVASVVLLHRGGRKDMGSTL